MTDLPIYVLGAHDQGRPGDPGYGCPPAEFLPASSVGQVMADLARRNAASPGCARSPGDAGLRRAAARGYAGGYEE